MSNQADPSTNPWRALWALCIGFFMILVDSTIVTVAMPDIMDSLNADINAVVWVTSAYLLAYVVPLLITGRLGDRFGPKRVYMVGLIIFTASSLWCGLTTTVGALIVARVVQGLGAAAMTPQTMAVITRMFPSDRRGPAMGMWGAVAGIATLVGPIAGGLLVDGFGWEWIFFVNVPVGIIAFVLAWRLVPRLETHAHSFDWLGVVLSACGLFLLVYGIQQAHDVKWGPLIGPVTVPFVIGGGVLFLIAFVLWQKYTHAEVLVPLSLFKDRNFTLASIAMLTVGFGITALMFPLMLWAQTVLGYSPTQSALLVSPMAILSGVLAPFVGKMVDRGSPRVFAGIGLGSFSIALFWIGSILGSDTSPWVLMPPILLLGVANGFMWAPISSTATRNLALHHAGAGSGVYNTVRQVGAVFGSAAIAVAMESRLAANIGDASGTSGGSGAEAVAAMAPEGGGSGMPESIATGFAHAMGQSLWLPAGLILIGFVAVLFFERPKARVLG
ncbi:MULTISPECIES: DHA2 family efflux MFS transporter permease subunit [unclassified Brevibacterium]|uniref:DHA2 family efflux MFS transporter permease subunit n=1 Tax=unclassified Brevibacterium TaxID=2614124 RepID=UPI0021527E04|nr:MULTISPECIES: DHA2 family efflux MFS transporter permease subunit [unclassified Brevibacterium]